MFPKMFLRQLNFGVLLVWQLFYLYCKEKCSLYCCLMKGVWALKVALQFAVRGLVAYKLVAYEKNKCIKSMPGFSISRLASLEDFLNVNIYFKCKYLKINGYLFKYVCVVCCLKIHFYCLFFLQCRIWIQVISQHQTSQHRNNS